MNRHVQIGLSTEDVKEALRRRHPAFDLGIVGVGRWVCIEEWRNIDLLALDCWRDGEVIGYEIKVSRADMRTELLRPSKRSEAVSMCTRFYFAVPAGMLKSEERDFIEPEWSAGDFERTRCEGIPAFGPPAYRPRLRRFGEKPRFGGQCLGRWAKGRRRKMVGPYTVRMPAPVILCEPLSTSEWARAQELESQLEHKGIIDIPCPACNGKGYAAKSRVELEAPTLWIPRDVGLVAVGPNGCSVIRQAPRRKVTEPIIPWPYIGRHRGDVSTKIPDEDASRLERQIINAFARWISYRPDPRHRRRANGDI